MVDNYLSSSADAGGPEIFDAQPASKEGVMGLLEAYPISSSTGGGKQYPYGTAGFRMSAELLPPVVVRVGLFAAYRSSARSGGEDRPGGGGGGGAVGVMVTASHNLERDNGVKIADPDGGMMSSDGEAEIVDVVNEPSNEKVLELVGLGAAGGGGGAPGARRHQEEGTALGCGGGGGGTVHVGRDTRRHSEELARLVIRAARAAGARVVDHGLITTPCLHHCVLHANGGSYLPPLIDGPYPNERGYYGLLAESYAKMLLTRDDLASSSTAVGDSNALLVDCACGIGYLALQQLVHEIQLKRCYRRIVATNRPTSGPLNEGCGSEHVQKSLKAPTWYENPPVSRTNYCASFDGDADRIVFFYHDDAGGDKDGGDGFRLLDGDKIACLFCNFLRSQLDDLVKSLPQSDSSGEEWVLPKLGVVQTAYANGASTRYLRQVLGPENVKIAATGVKHVHHAAASSFDIGVYFEANGHGTILFGEAFYAFIRKAEQALSSTSTAASASASASEISSGNRALERLKLLPLLVNQAVGDALSDLLLVDAALELQQLTIRDWNALYVDMPSRQTKVRVRDRTVIRTNDNETVCLEPDGVQVELDRAAAGCQGRAFIRPSGTEDVVRVYAEAPTREKADALADAAVEIVQRLCGGIANGGAGDLVSKI